MRYHPPRRGGFTLVELMMAAALAVLIMTVLAWAFSAATDNLRFLKATGDLASRLRTADVQLRADLGAPHFDDGDSGTTRLSDLRFDRLTPGGTQAAPPNGGFFLIRQGNGSIFEGTDQDTVYSTRGDGTSGHVLGMTVRRTGKTQDQLFTIDLTTLIQYANNPANPAPQRSQAAQLAIDLNGQSVSDVVGSPATVPVPATLAGAVPVRTMYASSWAEVYWFLDAQQVVGGVQSYALYRRTRLLTARPIQIATPPPATLYEQVLLDLFQVLSTHLITPVPPPIPPPPPYWETNTPDSIRFPANRWYAAPTTTPSRILPNTNPRYGDDIVLTNVLSFEVKAAWSVGLTPGSGQWTKTLPGPVTNTYARNAPSRVFPLIPLGTAVSIPLGTTYIPFPTPGPAASPALAYQNGDEPFDDIPLRNALQADPFRPENIGDEMTSALGPWNGVGGVGTRVFDTWAPLPNWNVPGFPTTIPFRARVSGVKVKVRVFDVNTQLSRQVTIVVPL